MEMYETMTRWHDLAVNQTDERSRSWLMMGSPLKSIVAMAAYLAVVCYGPVLMRNRQPWDPKKYLVVYNLALVALSAYMCSEFLLSAIEDNYSLSCQPVDFSYRPNAIRMLNVCWWYYISKYIEVLDTVFFVVRKKNSQITFLHVYHHATMIPFWWLAASFVPGGITFFHPLLNTGIHVLMYTYYGLAALGPKLQPFLWWKKYLTTLQLIQFVLIGLHVSYSLFFQPDCPYSKLLELLALAYAIILIIFFANFYRQAYVRKQQHKLADHETNGDAGGAVRFPCMLNDSEYTRGKGD